MKRAIRVLYSFPHRLGAQRICYTAWQQVNGLATAGANLAGQLSVSSFRARSSKPVTRVTAVTASRGERRAHREFLTASAAAGGRSGDERSTAAER